MVDVALSESEILMTDRMQAATAVLGGQMQPNRMELIFAAGEGDRRGLHNTDHFFDIAAAQSSSLFGALQNIGLNGEQILAADAVSTRAGFQHDQVYYQVDKGFPPGIEQKISKYFTKDEQGLRIQDNPALKNDQIFQMALTTFGFKPGDRLNPFGGQNEFLSALVSGVAGVEDGIPKKYILAEMQMMAGTVPFQSPDYFQQLENRVAQANTLLAPDERLSALELKGFSIASVDLANRDVISFTRPFDQFVKGTLGMVYESGQNLDSPQGALNATMAQAGFLSGVVAPRSEKGEGTIYHGIHGYPGEKPLASMESKARQTIKQVTQYLYANAAAASIAGALSLANGDSPGKISLQKSVKNVAAPQLRTPTQYVNAIDQKTAISALQASQDGVRGELPTAELAAVLLARLGAAKVEQIAKAAAKNGIDPQPNADPAKSKPGLPDAKAANRFLTDNVPPDLLRALSNAAELRNLAGLKSIIAKGNQGENQDSYAVAMQVAAGMAKPKDFKMISGKPMLTKPAALQIISSRENELTGGNVKLHAQTERTPSRPANAAVLTKLAGQINRVQ